QKSETIIELLVAADELGIQRLINSIQEFLIQNCLKFLQSDSTKILDLVTCHNAFDNVKEVYLETFNKNYKDLLRRNPIKILNFIIRHESFNEFIKVVLEIICENPEFLFNSDQFPLLEKDHSIFQSDVTKFTQEDFKTLGKTLHELVRLVRFHQIDGEDFMNEVWPFRQFIPDNLIEDLLHFSSTWGDGGSHDLCTTGDNNNYWQ
ncbi:165_t:CDS:2, partial [Racocetra fulgida]